ncbi:peptidoglycan-associated lipoprotein Pal [Altererythrobacter sp. H2]|uniref:peptidoglycan-associated lipoprotein Pal n=1 Tax=Altererythrobacter sp. H2 TaxID=3108391 RepID=UPI002B4BD1A4|nr:peptidoglycan-associated lipoprotein Pal [Altererythrobacter sp. H2]WRK95295.1 peptidoglycan-associated lipoprotein Pal [Altererythrobacter sp. H2]
MNRTFASLSVMAGALALSACKTTAPDVLPPDPVPSTGDTSTGGTTSQGPAVGSQAHFEQTINGQNVIYFDTDRYNIDSADAAALQTQAQYLARYPSVTITVEGHADERGTREYNLALGERRANSAKNYLVSLGVDAGRIQTVSYGKERPVALGSDEASWARNRRAVSVVIN